MTRAEVAKALGRSISTVRRMEGKELNPFCDSFGVHQFDPDEVENLAEDLQRHGRRQDQYAEEYPAFILESQLQSVRSDNEKLQKENARLQEQNALAVELLEITSEAISCAQRAGSTDVWDIEAQYRVIVSTLARDSWSF